ncbi:hypothetical protein SteCoe_18852 [Stentor coeruleus]|uniref:Uncharacterized protein n=1 Tax=Stentor coeruleus TaxID=5963 RepID=A0A1R2BVH6_9CILI|nr:hypothetical protein SteCoe_18852 [Stentor coeruleus]
MILEDKLLNLPRPAMKISTLDFKKKISPNKKIFMSSSVIDVHNKKKTIKNQNQNLIAEQFKNEKNLGKKIDLALNIVDIFLSPEPSFKVNWDFIKEILGKIKQELNCLGDISKEHYGFDCDYQKLQEDIKNVNKNLLEATKNISVLEKKITELKKENKFLKVKIMRNWDFFKSIQEAGVPIFKLYDNFLHKITRSKSAEKLKYKERMGCEEENIKRDDRHIGYPDVPKLKIDVRNVEGYQEEFMNMFQEFSESWRNQISNSEYKKY